MFFYMDGNGVNLMVKTISLIMHSNPLDSVMHSRKNALLKLPFKILNWEYAVDLCVEYDIFNAYVGLAEDWKFTCAQMIEDGEPCIHGINIPYGYCLASQWATPCLYDEDGDVAYECYYQQNNINWDIHVKSWWPDNTMMRYIYERG